MKNYWSGFVFLALALAVATQLCACGTSAGWRFEIGVAPVTAIHNEAVLTDKGEAK